MTIIGDPVESPSDALSFLWSLRPEWMSQGACRDYPREWWFPEQGGNVNRPVSICAKCPVQADCLAYALSTCQRYGIWGGKSERARSRLRATL